MEAVNNPGNWVKDTWGLSELGNFSLGVKLVQNKIFT